ncbi:MAG: hypothetical protein IPI67_17055 [Myxococcales bacterium]|nr:hypothetical protein [Myxococcales bacterium]
MERTLPPLGVFAAQVARALGGAANVFDSGEYPAAAVAFGGWHRVLIRDHQWALSVSLPTEHSWQLRTPEDWTATEPLLRAALTSNPVLSMSDLLIVLGPMLARRTGSAWSANIAGTSPPGETWLRNGARSVGLFQQPSSVRVVVWADRALSSQSFTTPEALGTLAPWLEAALDQQDRALLEAEAEARRKAALPPPDFDAVLALLKAGARICTSGARCNETFFWDGRLRREIFDEGDVSVCDGSEADLRRHMELYPDAFRRALAAGDRGQGS